MSQGKTITEIIGRSGFIEHWHVALRRRGGRLTPKPDVFTSAEDAFDARARAQQAANLAGTGEHYCIVSCTDRTHTL